MTTPASPSGFALPPSTLSSFIGRAVEVERLVELVSANRLVTVTGAGGSGKTRLAVEVTKRVAPTRDAIVWIDLAALPAGDRLADHVASGFRLTEREGDEAALEGIRTAIGDRTILIVLDNCEHVVERAAEIGWRLLVENPSLSILATSREALGIEGEIAWLVPAMRPDEGATLFAERARSVLPRFEPTAAEVEIIRAICGRVDGIPLAIELAAARVKVLSVQQILTRLDDALRLLASGSRTVVARQRTLKRTIEWSYQLLSPAEQTLLRRLAVFPASFGLDAVETIGSDEDLPAVEILDTFTGLVDKSLVVGEASEREARYRCLEAVRQFTAGLVEPNEMARLRRRHAEHYLAVVEAMAPSRWGSVRLGVDLAGESANLRAAVEWAAEVGAAEIGLRYVWALQWFWWARGSFQEAWRLVAALDAPVPTLVRIRALIGFSMMGNWQGRFEEGVKFGDEALRLLEAVDDPELLAMGLTMSGAAKILTGDPDGALVDTDRAIPLGLSHSKTIVSGIACHFRAMSLIAKGDIAGAEAAATEEIRILKQRSTAVGACHGYALLGSLALLRGDRHAATGLFVEALTDALRGPDNWGVAKSLEGIGIAIADDDPVRATRLLGAAEALRERIAHPMWPDEIERHRSAVARLEGRLGVSFSPHWKSGRGLPEAEAADLALGAATTAPAVAAPEPNATPPPPAAAGKTVTTAADLTITTLGRFAARRHGSVIGAAEWGSARPRELLVLLAMNPRGLAKDTIGAALWPDASPTQVRNNFHVTMHRLRKTLGEPSWIVVADDRYQLSPEIRVEIDAVAFDTEVGEGLAGLKRGDAAAAGVLAAAIGRYQGPFLDGEPVGDWALDDRDRLARRFSEAGVVYGQWLIGQERLADGIAILRTVTARDPLVEDAWRLMMQATARQGDQTGALRLYQQLEALLATDLESTPSPATTEIRDRIRRGEAV